MHKVKLVAVLLLAAALLTIILQNTGPVPMRILFMPLELPLAFLVGITTLVGFLLGLLAALLVVAKRRGPGPGAGPVP